MDISQPPYVLHFDCDEVSDGSGLWVREEALGKAISGGHRFNTRTCTHPQSAIRWWREIS